jgi:twitching motility protein PilT
MAKIDAFFNLMDDVGASDLHLASGSQPILRVRGEMERVKFPPLENDELKTMLYEIAPEYKVKVFEETGDVSRLQTDSFEDIDRGAARPASDHEKIRCAS